MADIFNKSKCRPNFPPPPPNVHHCRPNINININNDDNDQSDSMISPIIIDLINRINKVENKVDDFDDIIISGSSIELGEEEGQAYPGEKGAKNALDIKLISQNLIQKADKDEIPEPEIYFVESFDEIPQISGLYINNDDAKFWDGKNWHSFSLNTILSLSRKCF